MSGVALKLEFGEKANRTFNGMSDTFGVDRARRAVEQQISVALKTLGAFKNGQTLSATWDTVGATGVYGARHVVTVLPVDCQPSERLKVQRGVGLRLWQAFSGERGDVPYQWIKLAYFTDSDPGP